LSASPFIAVAVAARSLLMFDSLTKNLGSALKNLTGRGKLTEANMREALGEVRTSLLEADISLSVVKDFMEKISVEALGTKVLDSLNPTEQAIGVIHDALVELMGPVDHSLHLKDSGVTILMLCGLQGSGKTTTCGKLARNLLKQHRKPMLVGADLQRPAAIRQLEILAEQVGIPCHADFEATDPVKVCAAAIKAAQKKNVDTIILDTAGRLHVDQELMDQLVRIDKKVQPDQVYLVVDAMTGQDAVHSAKAFNDALEINGVIMTKLDGDARGGAALSVKHITGVPIKWIGTGEKLEALEEFHPDRMAGRILGQGDIVSLVQMAQEKLDQDKLAAQEEAMRKGEFTFENFRELITQTSKLGPMSKIMGMMPGMGQIKEMINDKDAQGEVSRLSGIIDSMTPQERRKPEIITPSRRDRIAAGAGVKEKDVGDLIKQFNTVAPMMKKMVSGSAREKMQMMREMQQEMSNPSGMFGPGGKKPKKTRQQKLTKKQKAQAKSQGKISGKAARQQRQDFAEKKRAERMKKLLGEE